MTTSLPDFLSWPRSPSRSLVARQSTSIGRSSFYRIDRDFMDSSVVCIRGTSIVLIINTLTFVQHCLSSVIIGPTSLGTTISSPRAYVSQDVRCAVAQRNGRRFQHGFHPRDTAPHSLTNHEVGGPKTTLSGNSSPSFHLLTSL